MESSRDRAPLPGDREAKEEPPNLHQTPQANPNYTTDASNQLEKMKLEASCLSNELNTPKESPPPRPPRPIDAEATGKPSRQLDTLWIQRPKDERVRHDLQSASPPPTRRSISPSKSPSKDEIDENFDHKMDSKPSRRPRPRPPPPRLIDASPVPSKGETEEIEDIFHAGVVTFDVGGTIFKCKARLLEKYPHKRLHRLILCGCERTNNTVFVDRNPAYFAVILDWYRMENVYLPDGVSLAGLQREATYFEVDSEMFPTAGALPKNGALPISQTPSKLVCFAKSYVHAVVPSQAPLVFILRGHEQLAVEGVSGQGRLLVRVADYEGTTTVSQAVLYDSHSYFFLGGGHTKLHGTPFPGNFIYTFWAQPLEHMTTPSSSSILQVEFQVRSIFHAAEQIELPPPDQRGFPSHSNGGGVLTSISFGSTPTQVKKTIEIKPVEPAAPSPPRTEAPSVIQARIPIQATTQASIQPAVKEHALSLPEKTKERAMILDETQQFQAKVKEHAAWLQHYQREINQQAAIPTLTDSAMTPTTSPKKLPVQSSQRTYAKPRK
ncbi:hypothetical protein AC1031_005193 [Aphanomyces cochlioides]|nr:hypothetical protein AC1031_005193 [Aphanomyces cochlioides]